MRIAAPLQRLLPLGLPLLALAVCFGRLIASPDSLLVDGARPSIDDKMRADARAIGNDLTRLFLPHHLRIAQRIARIGRFPLWDPAGFGGRPLVGNPQGGLFYPPVWLVWRAPWPCTLGWLTVGHLLWAGAGAYGLCRCLGMDRFASAVAASCFATMPYMLAQTYEGHYPHVWAASWYPWAFWAMLRWRGRDARSVLELPAILALMFLTGHPQEWYYLVLVLSAWVLVDAVIGWRRRASLYPPNTGAIWLPLGWLAMLALTIGLTAVQWVSDSLVRPWALRSMRQPLREASRYHINPLNVLQLLSPSALGGPADYFGHDNYWETVLSYGWVPVSLMAIAWSWSSRRAVVSGWTSLLAVALLFAAGHRAGVFALLYALVPGMDLFRVPARALFLANLAASVLVGLGVEAVGRADLSLAWRRYARLATAVLCVLLIAQAIAWWLGVGHDTPSLYSAGEGDGHWNRYRELGRWLRGCAKLLREPSLGLAILGVGAVLAWMRSRPACRRTGTVMLGCLAVAELTFHGHGLLRVAPASRFLGPDPIADALDSAPRTGPFRIRARDAFYPDLRVVARGYEKTNINDYFQLQHAADLYETLYPLVGTPRPAEQQNAALGRRGHARRQAVLDRMNVEYVITDQPIPDATWPIFAQGSWDRARYLIYRNSTALPRAYVVPRAELCVDAPGAVAQFASISARDAVLMTTDPLTAHGPRQAFTSAEYDATDPDRIRIQVTTAAAGLLVVADTWMPGWTARLEGRAVPIFRGNHAQRVVALPRAGQHTLIMTYWPPGLAAGIAVTTGSICVWLAGCVGLSIVVRQRARAARECPLAPGRQVPFASRTRDALTPSRAACEGTIPASGAA